MIGLAISNMSWLLLLSYFLLLAGDAGRRHDDLEIEMQLKLLNKPATRSFLTHYGDIFDCVDIFKQPAFDHPLLQNHTIQMSPTILLNESENNNVTTTLNALRDIIKQRCPKGTVPIRRTRKEELIWARSQPKLRAPIVIAGLLTRLGNGNFYGAKGTLNIWRPNVPDGAEYSNAQISVSNIQTSIQAGWMVNKKVFKDTVPRLFTYWTVDDNERSTGCFNIFCQGFVHVGNLPIAHVMPSISTFGDRNHQGEREFQLHRDPHTHNWWLIYDGNIKIGYWPRDIIPSLGDEGATEVFWGGEVASTGDFNGLEMGSGHYPSSPSEGYSKAAYIKKIQYAQDENGSTMVDPPDDMVFTSEATYSVYYGVIRANASNGWGCSIYFGGSPGC